MNLRERLLETGPEGLGDAELLAILLGTGLPGRPVLELAADILERAGGLSRLGRWDPAELTRWPGLGPARAARLLAAGALGRRCLRSEALRPTVSDPYDAHDMLGPGLRHLGHEELHALYLDRRRAPLGLRALTRGSDGFTLVDARQIYRPALAMGAAAVILAHNHPSGDADPSVQDRQVTEVVARAGATLGVPLLDHLVIGSNGFVSLAERGVLPRWSATDARFTA